MQVKLAVNYQERHISAQWAAQYLNGSPDSSKKVTGTAMTQNNGIK